MFVQIVILEITHKQLFYVQSCVPVCVNCFFSVVITTGHHWKEPGCVLFALLLQIFMFIDEIFPDILFPRLNSLSAFSDRKGAPVLSPTSWPFTGLYLVCLCLSCTGSSRTGPSTIGVASPVLNRGVGSLPSACWQHSSLWILLACFSVKAHSNSTESIRTLKSSPANLFSSWAAPRIKWHPEFFLLRWKNSMLNFIQWMPAQFFSLTKTLSMAEEPSGYQQVLPALCHLMLLCFCFTWQRNQQDSWNS